MEVVSCGALYNASGTTRIGLKIVYTDGTVRQVTFADIPNQHKNDTPAQLTAWLNSNAGNKTFPNLTVAGQFLSRTTTEPTYAWCNVEEYVRDARLTIGLYFSDVPILTDPNNPPP